MNKNKQAETVLEYLIKICEVNGLQRTLNDCKAMLYSAYQVSETILVEEDWGIVYERVVLIRGRRIRFYPTTYYTKNIPNGWEWSWSTVTFVTKGDVSASKLDAKMIEELKIRSGFYKIMEEVNEGSDNTLF